MPGGCSFCAFVEDKGLVPHWIAESEGALAFLAAQPVSRGHTLVISKKHAFELSDVSDEDWKAVSVLTLRVVQLVRGRLGTQGEFLYLGSQRRPDRQFPHLHLHGIPRRPEDDPRMGDRWEEKVHPVAEGELETLAARLRE